MNKDFVAKEQHRQEVIARAVESAEYILKDAGFTDPDVIAYLWYKTGAQLLLKGLAEGIDKRVMLSDMGLTALVALEPTPKPVEEHQLKLCSCGRYITWSDNELDPIQICSGCYRYPEQCDCKKLTGQLKP